MIAAKVDLQKVRRPKRRLTQQLVFETVVLGTCRVTNCMTSIQICAAPHVLVVCNSYNNSKHTFKQRHCQSQEIFQTITAEYLCYKIMFTYPENQLSEPIINQLFG